MSNMDMNCLDFCRLLVHMYYFTFSESDLAIYFLFIRKVINELAVSGEEMELKTRNCIATQIRSLQPQGTILTQIK